MSSNRFSLLVASILLLLSFSCPAYENMIVYPHQVKRVYDGDTFYVDFPNISSIFGEDVGIRIVGIDTPEIRSSCPNPADKEAERRLAEAARDYVTQRLSETKTILLANPDRDKYYRIDANVLFDGADIAQELVDKKYAVYYDGKSAKPDWCELWK